MAKSKALVNVDAELQKEVENIQKSIGTVTGNKIRINSNARMFRTPDGAQHPGPLGLVVVDFASVNTYYEGIYDPNNMSPPACFAIGEPASLGGPTNDNLIPSINAPERQSETCSECMWNQWKSDARGTGKACKNTRLLACVAPEEDPETTPIVLLSVSPASLKPFLAYVAGLRTQGIHLVQTVTEISFDKTVTNYAQLAFASVSPNAQYASHYNRRDEIRMLLAQEPDTSSYEAKAAAKAKPARKSKVAAKKGA